MTARRPIQNAVDTIRTLEEMIRVAKQKKYSLSSLMVLISHHALEELRYNAFRKDEFIFNGRQIMGMDYEEVDRRDRRYFVDIVVKLGAANYQDIPFEQPEIRCRDLDPGPINWIEL
jgi:hypothetical protein